MTRTDYDAACVRYMHAMSDCVSVSTWTRRHTLARQRWLKCKRPPSYRRKTVREAAEWRRYPFPTFSVSAE
jgi:hypothetical protein